MHFRNVELFCEVAAQRSFSKAAEAQNLSQSYVSQVVHHLEDELGLQLIDRSKRPLELTPPGTLYFDGCKKVLDDFRRIEESVRGMANQVVGPVRIAAIYSVGLLQMDAYLKRFQDEFPKVEIHIDYLHPSSVDERIRNDQADLGVVSFAREGGEIGMIPWQDQEMGLVVASSHPLAQCESIPVNEICHADFVALHADLKIRKEIDRWLKKAKVPVNIVYEFDNVENVKRAVEVNHGVSLLPIPTVARETEMGTLAVVRLEEVEWKRPLGIIFKRQRSLSMAASKFVELLQRPIVPCISAERNETTQPTGQPEPA